jgi:hypothetical protein
MVTPHPLWERETSRRIGGSEREPENLPSFTIEINHTHRYPYILQKWESGKH